MMRVYIPALAPEVDREPYIRAVWEDVNRLEVSDTVRTQIDDALPGAFDLAWLRRDRYFVALVVERRRIRIEFGALRTR